MVTPGNEIWLHAMWSRMPVTVAAAILPIDGGGEMLTANKKTLDYLERDYPGIKASIRRFEKAKLPACPRCGSENTADVQVGIIGRTIHIAGATTKFKLIPNGPKPGEYFCNACNKFFNVKGKDKAKKSGTGGMGFTLRVKDKSLEAFKQFIMGATLALNPNAKDDTTPEEWERSWREFWGKKLTGRSPAKGKGGGPGKTSRDSSMNEESAEACIYKALVALLRRGAEDSYVAIWEPQSGKCVAFAGRRLAMAVPCDGLTRKETDRAARFFSELGEDQPQVYDYRHPKTGKILHAPFFGHEFGKDAGAAAKAVIAFFVTVYRFPAGVELSIEEFEDK